MRCPHLLSVEHRDQRSRGNRELVNGRAVECNRNNSVADATHQTLPLAIHLVSGEITQRSFNRGPIGFLSGGQPESAFNACDVDRRRRLRGLGIRCDFPRVTRRNIQQQANHRERDGTRAYSHFHF